MLVDRNIELSEDCNLIFKNRIAAGKVGAFLTVISIPLSVSQYPTNRIFGSRANWLNLRCRLRYTVLVAGLLEFCFS